MDAIRQAAFLSVARGTGFAGLAILITVLGLSFDPVLAGRTGGVLCLLTSMVLMLRARLAPSVDHRRTEVWLILEERQRPPADTAQRLTAQALVDAYTLFASHAAAAAAALFAMAAISALVS